MRGHDDAHEFEGDDDGSEFEPKPAPARDHIVDKRTLAQICGLTPAALDQAVKAGMPVVEDGRRGRGTKLHFALPAAIQWLLARGESSLETARRESLEAIAEKRRIESARLAGRFVDIEAVITRIESNVAIWRSKLLALPSRLRADIRDEVVTEVEGVLNELSIELPKDES